VAFDRPPLRRRKDLRKRYKEKLGKLPKYTEHTWNEDFPAELSSLLPSRASQASAYTASGAPGARATLRNFAVLHVSQDAFGFHVDSRPAFRYIYAMEVTLDLPDELSAALAGSGQDLPRAALEAMALEAYRERKLTTAQLRRLLGFKSRYELDGFLKQHEVWLDYTWGDLEQDRETHRRLGF